MKHICRLFIRLSFCFYVASAVGQTVDIPDSNVRAEVEAALGKTAGATITIADMLTLTHFDFDLNTNIINLTGSNLTGLENAMTLTGQGLVIDNISYLSRFGNLDNLEWLFLWGNNISSLGTLQNYNLRNLRGLHLGNNNISRISGLGNVDNLEWLFLGDNNISSLGTLQNYNLRNLRGLHLGNNNISRISGLGNVDNLEWLFLGDNNISSLGTLQNYNLRNLRGLHLGNNNISRISGLGNVDNLEWLFLGDNNISSLGTLQNYNLRNLRGLHLGNNNISRISGLGNVDNLEWLFLGDNNISSLGTLQNYNLRNLRGLHLGNNNLTITDASFLRQRGVEVLFDEEVIQPVDATPEVVPPVDTTPPVNIPDPNLRARIEAALGKASGAAITTADMENLKQHFNAYSANINNLTGLEYAINLRWLSLYDNNISDISPLVSNTGLGTGDTVDVTRNPLSSVSLNTHIPTLQRRGVTVLFDAVVVPPVDTTPTVNIPDPNLRAKIEADLGKATGATITRVDMETLTRLDANSANISRLTGLEYATKLRWLSLYDNNISDISPVTGLANLTHLLLNDNNISNISPVAGLANLTDLLLSDNNISNISPVTGLANLTTLLLEDNNISDISAVRGLTNLTVLWLRACLKSHLIRFCIK